MKLFTPSRSKRLYFGIALVVILVGGSLTGVARNRGAPEGSGGGGLFSPSIALAAPAGQIPYTFDSGGAGLSAHLDLGTTIDLATIRGTMSTVYYPGPAHAVGVPASCYSGLLYASTSGWLVAYAPRGGTGQAACWTKLAGYHTLDGLHLENALEAAVTALGMDWSTLQSQVGYYHFGYPTATKMTYFSKIRMNTVEDMTFQVPATRTLHEASWSANTNRVNTSALGFELDGQAATNMTGTYYDSVFGYRKEGQFTSLSVGTTHTITVDADFATNDTMGVTVFLTME